MAGLVAADGLNGFVGLILFNAATYLVYVVVLAVIVGEAPERPASIRGGYRRVIRDRAFVHPALIHVAMIAVGWGAFSWLIPPYARNDLGLSARLIGLLLLANAATVVVAQVPIARLAEGRRRVVMIAIMPRVADRSVHRGRSRRRRGRRVSALGRAQAPRRHPTDAVGYWYRTSWCTQNAKNSASRLQVIGQLRVRRNATSKWPKRSTYTKMPASMTA